MCQDVPSVVNQIDPTIHLLKNIDTLYPIVLQNHGIVPSDYHNGLVFRSAVESIRGTFIASSTPARQRMVGEVLAALKQNQQVHDFQATSSGSRCDFEVQVQPNYYAAIEVKGGEGNSIGISNRRLSIQEFCIWSHLDGAVRNQPGEGALKVLGRIANDMTQRNKLVDAIFFKDILCGTTLRPCPKYPGQETTIGLRAAPDIFLFPQRVPSVSDPTPPVHTLQSLKLPTLLLDLFGIPATEYPRHIWEVHLEVVDLGASKRKRKLKVIHQGQVVTEAVSNAWTE